jgi:hypothetical protein
VGTVAMPSAQGVDDVGAGDLFGMCSSSLDAQERRGLRRRGHDHSSS